MKTLKSIALGLALLATVATANAAVKPEKLTKNHAIETYVDAVSHGKLAGINDVLDDDVKFSMMRGKEVMNFDKSEMVKYLKNSENVEQACTVTTSEVESNDMMAVVKVDMKFDGFTRSNFVTISNTGEGWKITNVHTVFK